MTKLNVIEGRVAFKVRRGSVDGRVAFKTRLLGYSIYLKSVSTQN